MRAVVVRSVGGGFDLEELRDPTPGPGEVLVRVAGSGLCHTDLHVQDGSVKFLFPAVLGHEVSGTVVQVGPGVTHVASGDQVTCGFIMPCGECKACSSGREELCEPFFAHNRGRGTLYDGHTRLFDSSGNPVWMYSMAGLAEYCVMPALAAAKLPAGVPLADAAILGCAFLTAYGSLQHVGRVSRTDSVIIIGAGGVGLSTVAVARALGVEQIIAIDLSQERLDAASRLGATTTLNGRDVDTVAAVRDLTAGGADVVIEVVGSPHTVRQATQMAGPGGRCVLVGIAPAGQTAEFEITPLVRREVQILGCMGGRPRTDLPILGELVAQGELDPSALISRRFRLEEAGAAYRLLEEGQIVGRAIIEHAS